MTVQQLHIGLELALQQVNSNLFNRLEPEEKDYYLNEGVNLYLNSIIEKTNKDNVLSYNEIVNRYSKLHTLIVPVTLDGSNNGSFIFDVDWYHVFRIDVVKDNKLIPVRLLINEDVTGEANDSYGTSSFSYIAEILNSDIQITPFDGVEELNVIYLKQPAIINFETNTTSDLPAKTHYDIINFTVNSIISKYLSKNAAATGQIPQNKQ